MSKAQQTFLQEKEAITSFWVVRDATPKSSMQDVMFKANVDEFASYILGAGSKDNVKKENLTIYPDTASGKEAAFKDAQTRLKKVRTTTMQKEGYVIALNKKQNLFFTSASAYDKPSFVSIAEATKFLTADAAQVAVKKLWMNGVFEAKIVPLAELMVNFDVQDQEDVVPASSSQEDEKDLDQDVVDNELQDEDVCPKCECEPCECPINDENDGTDEELKTESIEKAEPPLFQKGQKVLKRGEEFVVVDAMPDTNVIVIAKNPQDPTTFQKVLGSQLALSSEEQEMAGQRRAAELMWRENPLAGSYIWVKTQAQKAGLLGTKVIPGKKYGPFPTPERAKQFMINRGLKGAEIVREHESAGLVESPTMPPKPPLDAQPSENKNTVPNLKEPKTQEVNFKDPVGTEDKPLTDLTTATAWQHDEKVKLPADVEKSLKQAIVSFKSEAEALNHKDDTRASFCFTVADAFQALLDDLKKETVEGIKQAQIRYGSWMNAITMHLPDNVKKYIYYGGRKPSLKDMFNERWERVRTTK